MKRTKRLYLYFSIIALSITVLPYFIFAFFSVPTGDDYAFASDSLEQGILEFIKHRYLTWNGRYSSDFLISVYNVIGHQFHQYFLIKFFALIPLSLLTLYGISGYIFIKLLTGCKDFILNLSYSLTVLVAIILNTRLTSTVFWLAGGFAYGMANSLLIILFTFIVYTTYMYKEENKNFFLFPLAIFLIVFTNGLSETIMISCTSLIISFAVLNIMFQPCGFNKEFVIKNLTYLGFALISAMIVILAPGNNTRMDKIDAAPSNSGSLLYSTVQSFWSTRSYLFDWINPLWICFFVLIIMIIHQVPQDKKSVFINNSKIFFILITSLFIALYMSFFVTWYSLGHASPPRSVSTSYTIFMLITMMLGFYCSLKLHIGDFVDLQKISRISLMITVTFCMIAIGLYLSSVKHDLQILQKHHRFYQKVYSLATNAEPDSHLVLPPEPKVKIFKPSHEFWSSLSDNKNSYANQSFAKYFKLKSVSTSRHKSS